MGNKIRTDSLSAGTTRSLNYNTLSNTLSMSLTLEKNILQYIHISKNILWAIFLLKYVLIPLSNYKEFI